MGLGEQIRALQCANIKKGILAEVEENIRLYRTKNGLDTNFIRSPQMLNTLEAFLKILDKWRSVDVDFDDLTPVLLGKSSDPSEVEVDKFIKEKLRPERWNVMPVDPVNAGAATDEEKVQVRSPWVPLEECKPSYYKDQKQRYQELRKDIEKFLRDSKNIPVGRGKTMRGFPVHFSTSEPEKIREYLQNCNLFREFKDIGLKKDGGSVVEDVSFAVSCHVERLQGSILSVWFYIAVQEPVKDT